jgi:hypothetical protein
MRKSVGMRTSLEHGLQTVNACHAPRTGTEIQLVAVMTNALDFSIPQYAVIEARRTDGPSERFVIAYSDERALRDLIAGPSIIGCGFATREQAQVHADVWRPLESEQPQGLRTTSRREIGRRILSAQQRLRAAFDLMEAGRIVRGFLTAANAAAILTFYSRHSVLVSRGHLLQRCFAFRRDEMPPTPAVARTTSL